jgi:hypothetical protein
MTWEGKILNKIYGSKCEQGVWRIRSNLEPQNVYMSPDIVTEIKIRRREWLGHVIRMEDTCIPKMIFNTKPEGRRGVGRLKLRCLDDVKRWRLKAEHRKEWTVNLRDDKVKLKMP